MNVMQFLVEWNKNGQSSLCFIVLNEFCNFINMCHILSCWAYFLQNISSYFYANSKYFETYYSRFNQICSLLNAKFDIKIIMKIQRYERMVASLLVSVVEEIELNSFSIEFYLHLSQVNKKFSLSLFAAQCIQNEQGEKIDCIALIAMNCLYLYLILNFIQVWLVKFYMTKLNKKRK